MRKTIIELITKKRDGISWTSRDIADFVEYVGDESVPDYQISAALMAIYLRGMSEREVVDLTLSMVHSGETILKDPGEPIADKHSTGGVGDKTSIILMPLLAAAGIKTVKLSGKGLGHTGGTLDKLAALPGFRTDLSTSEIRLNLSNNRIVLSGQTPDIVPADKRMYALRDLTATVDSIPLIASSIMSKKIASGANVLLLDVKVGNGAIFEDLEKARKLARLMVQIGTSLGVKTKAILTDMSIPLGNAIGNAIEIRESMEILSGGGPTRLRELCVYLAAEIGMLHGKFQNREVAQKEFGDYLDQGVAKEKMIAWIRGQGGDISQIEDIALGPVTGEIIAESDGYISVLHARKIGLASMQAGAGRMKKEDEIDLTAGIYLEKQYGDTVREGDILFRVYSSSEEKMLKSMNVLHGAYEISPIAPAPLPLVLEEIE